jgi:ribosomal protein S18 acetylase RimI-like enzyme
MRYRHFRNADPPALIKVWNESLTGRGAVELRSTEPFEVSVLNKPYFDSQGLIVAEVAETKQLVGFVHAGFGPTLAGDDIDKTRGVICTIAVLPSFRRRGIGTELMRRAEDYLVASGTRELVAGCLRPLKPFYTGLYGGSNAAGFLESDVDVAPFMLARGYEPRGFVSILQRKLDSALNIVDTRFTPLRRRYEGQAFPMTRLGSWWRECVLGPLDPGEFRLDDKQTGQTAARALFWEMKDFGWRWGTPAAGIVDVQVRSELRRQGLGKYLVAQLLRHLQDQYFGIAEVHVPEGEDGTSRMFQSLGFEKVDRGIGYIKRIDSRPGF